MLDGVRKKSDQPVLEKEAYQKARPYDVDRGLHVCVLVKE
jgi:hypothetical protein